jgi:PAS domain S-box-containing protein
MQPRRESASTSIDHDNAREILDTIDVIAWDADPETLQRTFVSRYAEGILGYPVEQWLREPDFWRNHVHSEDRDRALSKTLESIKRSDRYTIEYRLIDAKGRSVWMRDAVRVLRDASGKPRLLRGVMMDVSELRKTMELLRGSEERFRLVVEGARDYAIFTMSLQGEITTWNKGAESLFGYTGAEAVGRPARMLFTPEDNQASESDQEIQRALQHGRSVNERWHMHKSGRRFWGSGLMMPLKDDHGRDIGLFKILRDNTEQRRAAEKLATLNAELELRVAERTAQLDASNKELEAFTYSVSHDLHAPLRKIDGFSRIISEDCGDKLDAQSRQNLDKIRAAAQQMARLIDAFLGLARVVRGAMRRDHVDLSDLARSIAEDLKASDPSREVGISIAGGLSATGDAQLLRIALFNLMDNAWKFTKAKEGAAIEFGALAGADQPIYYVRDNGAGFDMAYSPKLFREFSRLHERGQFEGTGVGLATVKRIIARHGGKIWAEGKVGQGASFYFTLGALDKTSET